MPTTRSSTTAHKSAVSPALMARMMPILAEMQTDPPYKQASLIVDRLYLSNYTVASTHAKLQELGITHVLSVIDHGPPDLPENVKGLHVSLSDNMEADILKYLDITTDYIKSALAENENNKVLVHCLMGISRSATVVCAYLIATMGLDATDAVNFVVQRRSIVSPNLGFRYQLEVYTAKLSGKSIEAIARTTRSRYVPRRVQQMFDQSLKRQKELEDNVSTEQ